MRIAVLWIELTGYLNACLRNVASRPGVELFVAHTPPGSNAPFDGRQFAWIPQQLVWRSASDLGPLTARLDTFRPDVLVVAGWAIPAYRRAAKEWRSRAVRIMTMDNCWKGSPAQWIAGVAAPVFIPAIADAIWLPGERQAKFAHRLGFNPGQILRGLYACDYSAFAVVQEARLKQQRPLQRAFIFIGRMIETKGVSMLAAAYRLYRSRSEDPWPLICCGQGPLAPILEAEVGVIVEGFVQPESLPGKLAQAACLILPSEFEAWGLVVHEAAAAGLLILASEMVGSVPHLVQDHYNGFVFGVGDAEGLSRLMERVSLFSDERLNAMAAASASLARQFTPARWADTLLDFGQDTKQMHGHA